MTKRAKPSDRIIEIMNEKGLKQVDIVNRAKPFQEKYGIKLNKSHISQYVNGVSNPDQEKYFILSKILGVTEPWLMGYDVQKYNKEENITSVYNQLHPIRQEKVYHYAEQQLEEQNHTQTVVTLGKTAAGEPIYQEDIIEEEKEVTAIPSGADVALVIQGDSMEPDFENGSVVFYKKQPQVENGELAVVHIKDDGITFKKVLFDYDKKKIILRSLNDKYEDKVSDADSVNILGKVIT